MTHFKPYSALLILNAQLRYICNAIILRCTIYLTIPEEILLTCMEFPTKTEEWAQLKCLYVCHPSFDEIAQLVFEIGSW